MLKEAERLAERLRGEGKEVVTYLAGRKGEAYYRFRQRAVGAVVDRLLRQPALRARQARSASALIDAFIADTDDEGGVDEVHIVYTRFGRC